MFVTIVKRKMQIDERRWLRGQVLAKIKAEGQIREQDEIKKRGSERRTMMDGGEEEQEALIISLLWPKWAVSSCSGIKRSLSQLLYLFIYLFFFSRCHLKFRCILSLGKSWRNFGLSCLFVARY